MMKKLIMMLLAFVLLSSIALAQLNLPCTTDDDCAPEECCFIDDSGAGQCDICSIKNGVEEVPEFSTFGGILAVAIIGITTVFLIKKKKIKIFLFNFFIKTYLNEFILITFNHE